MENKIYLTSDLHLMHQRPFLYEPRGFSSVYEMNDAIVNNWNSIINMEDHVYVLGDLMLNDNEGGLRLLKQLKGHIHIVRGNHDSNSRMGLYSTCYNVVEITEGQFLNYKNYHFYLSHYPCICSNWDYDKPLKARCISLCGHSHVKDPFADWDKGLIYHVELDTNNCYPWLIDNIIENIKEKINEK